MANWHTKWKKKREMPCALSYGYVRFVIDHYYGKKCGTARSSGAADGAIVVESSILWQAKSVFLKLLGRGRRNYQDNQHYRQNNCQLQPFWCVNQMALVQMKKKVWKGKKTPFVVSKTNAKKTFSKLFLSSLYDVFKNSCIFTKVVIITYLFRNMQVWAIKTIMFLW